MSKHAKRKNHSFRLAPVCAAVLLAFSAQTTEANPNGGVVVNGQASFASSGNALTVTNTPGTIINWQSFSIQQNEITRFAQQSASSAVLNRVITNSPSNILGTLQSNGRVFLINPNGILFGQGATVDVAGLVATTLNLSNADFLAGRLNFTQQPGAQNISNAGSITAQQGGEIYLIAPNVDNSGIIKAPNGDILLAAGHEIQLVNSLDPNLRVNVTAPAGDATNVGQLIASSGSLGLFGAMVKNTGTVNANSAALQGGKIVLRASQRVEAGGTVSAQGVGGGEIKVLSNMQTGTVSVSGTLDASAPIGGNGGFIDTSAAHVQVADTARITTAAPNGKAGTWLIDPLNVTIGTGVDTGGSFSGGIWSPIASGSFITSGTIAAALNAGTNVTITTVNAGFAEAGDINVNAAITKTAIGVGLTTLTLKAENNIVVAAGVGISTSGDALGVVLNSDSDGIGGGAIVMNTGSSIVSGGGNVTLGGGSLGNGSGNATGNATLVSGIDMLGASINSGVGNITLNGQGYGVGGTNMGVYLHSGASLTTTSGTVTINGIGGGDGTLGSNRGVRISSASNITTGTGNIGITGQGGWDGDGVQVVGGSQVKSTSGLITLAGTSGSGTGLDYGIYLADASTLVETSGNILFTGVSTSAAGADNKGIALYETNLGIPLTNGPVVRSLLAGNITFNGTGGGGTNFSSGMTISGSEVSVADGTITFNGTSGSATGTDNRGVNLHTGAWVHATGLGNINMTGVAVNTATSSLGSGVRVATGAVVETTSGAINITGSGTNGTDSNYGVQITDALSAVKSVSGAVTIAGSDWGTGVGNYGVYIGAGGAVDTGVATTLQANRDIYINSTLNITGTLALLYGQAALAAGNTGTYVLGPTGQVNLAAGPNFSTKLGSDGVAKSYTVITALGAAGDATVAPVTMSLQGMNTSLAGNYVLGTNIDATATSGWNTGAGFMPVGNGAWNGVGYNYFTGQFDGLGHTIAGLNINSTNSTTNIGMFGYIGSTGAVRNVGLVGGSVFGSNWYVGTLAGYNAGLIADSYSTANVLSYNYYLGGLVGRNDGTIKNSYATGIVSGSNSYIGGLAGINVSNITNSYATGAVTGTSYVGGLVGQNNATITGSYATGNVSGTGYIGGLVGGTNGGTINSSNSTSVVSGTSNVGGLVGYNNATINNSYHITGGVSGGSYVGGLVGNNAWVINSGSYAIGTVTATTGVVGGLVGGNSMSISGGTGAGNGIYASGTVNGGGANVGGLVGYNTGSVSNAYVDASTVVGTTSVGGLVGGGAGTVTNAHYNYNGVLIQAGSQFTPTNQFTPGAIFNDVLNNSAVGQYTDWINGGLIALNIANYSTDLPTTGANAYSITSLQGMKALVPFADVAGNTFTQTAAIDLATLPGLYIHTLASNYDGGGFTLSNLNINQPGANALGLFGHILSGVTVSNVALVDVSVTGANQVGALAGWNEGTISNSSVSQSTTGSIVVSGANTVGGLVGNNVGTVSSSFISSGSVTGTANNVGGLAGRNIGNIGSGSYAMANVAGASNVGGLVGQNYLGNIVGISGADVYATGTVSGTQENVGGLVGYNYWNGVIDFAHATGNVSGAWAGVGGLVGRNESTSSISNSYAGGNVTGSSFAVGGLAGWNNSSTVSSSYATGNVAGYSAVGGLVGDNNSGTISASYHSTGTVSGTTDNVGGLVGYNYYGTITGSNANGSVTGRSNIGGLVGNKSYGSIADSYFSSGNVIGTSILGGLVGYNLGGSITNSHYNIDAVTIGTTAGAAVTGQVTHGGIYSGQYAAWKAGAYAPLAIANFASLTNTVTNTYTINNVQGMQDMLGFTDQAGLTFILTAPVTVPAGYSIPWLAANFDGGSQVITGVNINQPYNNNVGFIGISLNVPISNVSLVDASVIGADTVGALVGWNQGTITNSSVSKSGTGSVVVSGNGMVGGLVGTNGGTISNSFISGGSVTGVADNVGGLVGSNYSIIDLGSYASTTVLGYGTVGGLVGNNQSGSSVSDSHASGVVSGVNHVGGLAGNNNGTINTSYSNGSSVTGTGYGGNVGGLAGINNGTINTSYRNGGSVTGIGNNVGGLVGANYNDISGSYVSGVAVSGMNAVGGLVGYHATGATYTWSPLYGAHINNSYVSSGSVVGTLNLGGLVGSNAGGPIANSHYNVDGVLIGTTLATASNQVTLGGLYNTQYTDWVNGSYIPLAIANYTTSFTNTGTYATAADIAAGLGAQSGTYYTLSVANNVQAMKDLLAFSEDSNITFKLGANTALPAGYSVQSMKASFDGNGFTLTNLNINQPYNDYVGLFRRVDAGSTLSNIAIVDAMVTGNNQVGVLAGSNAGTISNSNVSKSIAGSVILSGASTVGGLVGNNTGTIGASSVSGGSVTGSGDFIGGLVGQNSGTINASSYSSATVSGGAQVGGLVGFNNQGSVADSWASGSVTGSNEVGGLVGNNYRGTISGSHASGNTTGDVNVFYTSSIGGLVGRNGFGSTINLSYATGAVSGGSYIGGLVGLNVASIVDSHASGNVTATDPYYSYAGGLVGESSYAVENCSWYGCSYSYGSIGSTATAYANSLSYATGNVTGTNYVGGLVGYGSQSSISGYSYATGNVTGASYVGGLVGLQYGYLGNGSIVLSAWDSSTSASRVMGSGSYVGGLVGYANGISISDSHAIGNVTASGSSVGGLVGNNYSTTITSTGTGFVDSQTYATGNVTGAWDVGGLVGQSNYGNITNYCYASGSVTGIGDPATNSNGDNVGGVIGYRYYGTVDLVSWDNTVSGASISGFGGVGGLIGFNIGSVSNSSVVLNVTAPNAVGVKATNGSAGGLIGSGADWSPATISNSSVTINVSGNNSTGVAGADRVGGLMGGTNTSNSYTITNNHVIANVTGSNSFAVSGNNSVGGLLGYAVATITAGNYVSGMVLKGTDGVGGLVGSFGYELSAGSMDGAYVVSGSLTGTSNVGGLIGRSNNINNTITNSHYNVDAVTLNGGRQVTRGGLYGSQYTLWTTGSANNGNAPYGVLSILDFASLTGSATVYSIADVQGMKDLLGFADVAGNTFNLTAPVALPVGYNVPILNANFNGGSNAITGLDLNLLNDNIGLFGQVVATSTVNGVSLVDAMVLGNTNVGALVGLNMGTISNSSVTNAAGFTVSGNSYVGGLVGWVYSGTINNGSFASTDVSGSGDVVGGLVGRNSGNIAGTSGSHVYATGTVTGASQVGGLVGDNGFAINFAHATGNVSGLGNNVGGLVGMQQYGSTLNSYAAGTVTGAVNVGGLIGANYYGSSVDGSYASGASVVGTQNIGGLVGTPWGTLTNSHYNVDTMVLGTSLAVASNQVTLGGLYTLQFNDWIAPANNFAPLLIASYATSLAPATLGSYTIGDVQGMKDLLAFADTAGLTFTLTAATPVALPAGYNIPMLAANFDGGSLTGNTVTGLNINLPNDNLGLFGNIALGTTVSNVSLVGASVTGGNSVGALAGRNDGAINNSNVSGSVVVNGLYDVGGLVGWNNSTIDASYVGGGSVSGVAGVGGLVGHQTSGGFTFLGSPWGARITNSYVSSGSVIGTSSIGGLVGNTWGGPVTNSHYNVDAVTIGTSAATATNTVTFGGLYTVQFNDWIAPANNFAPLLIANYATSLAPVVATPGSYTIGDVQGMKDLLAFADTAGLTFNLTTPVALPVGYNVPLLAANFDGGSNIITGLSVDLPTDNLGLFGHIALGSTVSNVTIVDATVTGNNYVGALSGWNEGTIINSNVSKSVAGSVVVSGYSQVGGLVGRSNGAISNSYVNGGTVNGGSNGSSIGGLVGNSSGAISTSYVNGGTVNGGSSASSVGGLVGYSSGTISDSYVNGGTVNAGGSTIGGLVGQNNGDIINSFVSNGSVNAGAGSWDVGGLAGQNRGNISGSHVDQIVVTGGTHVGGLVGQNYGSTSLGVAIRGNISNSFVSSGTVNGDTDVGGLIGYNSSGDITNTHASNVVVTGIGNDVGGLVGYNYGWHTSTWTGSGYIYSYYGTISNSYVNGAVVGGNSSVGGLVGYNWHGNISNSHASNITVTGSGNEVGGLVGHNRGGNFSYWNGSSYIYSYYGAISNSYMNGGTVSSTGDDVGGLVGRNRNGLIDTSHVVNANVIGGLNVGGLAGSDSGEGAVSNSYASNVMVAGTSHVGGLVGGNFTTQSSSGYGNGFVINSYVNGGTVSGVSSVGGLVGYSDVDISQSYVSSGLVTGTSNVGGLVGFNDNNGWVHDNVWDTQTTGQVDAIGGAGSYSSSNNLIGLTTADFFTQANFDSATAANGNVNLAWDFINTWWMIEGNTRPMLRSEYSTTITSAHQLQMIVMDATTLAANYTLAENLNLAEIGSAGSLWNNAVGFMPLGDSTTSFSGLFDGASHTISNLYVNRPTISAGLFGYTAAAGVIQNVGLVGGSVTGGAWGVGGLVGYNNGTIANSYSTGAVSGDHDVGGLVGDNWGAISNSYSTASVTSINNGLGGLVGANYITIDSSYSTGAVSGGTTFVGGLVGYSTGTITNSYWNVQTSAQTSSAGGTGLTTAQMKTMSSFSGWSIANTGGAGATWRIYEGNTTPLLTSFLTPISVIGGNEVKTYDGLAYSGNAAFNYSIPNPILGNLFGGAGYQNVVNVGTYTLDSSGMYSNQQGYEIVGSATGTLTVDPAELIVTADAKSKFQGTFDPLLTYMFTGLVGGDTQQTISGSLSRVAGEVVGHYQIQQGSLSAGSNYSITYHPNDLVIKAIPVSTIPVLTTTEEEDRIIGSINNTVIIALAPFEVVPTDAAAATKTAEEEKQAAEDAVVAGENAAVTEDLPTVQPLPICQ